MQINKNRNRASYTFANINLLGKCNANCYFCLGKDIPELLNKHDQTQLHWSQWKNFDLFLSNCCTKGIKKLYLTGQNTDALVYKYFDEFQKYIQEQRFLFGIRTNGYLINRHIESVRSLNDEIGLSLHSLSSENNFKIMGRKDLIDLKDILPKIKSSTNKIRVAVVINRYNKDEIIDLIKYLSKFPQIDYIQARRISTDTRYDLLKEDIEVYEQKYQEVSQKFETVGNFYGAQLINMFGKSVCWWRTVETSANSLNYFTDGTISDNYFVVEGYLNNYRNG